MDRTDVDRFIARRVCGGVVRSRQEWAAHPQGRAIGDPGQAATGMSFREGQAAGGVPRLAPAAVNDYSTGFLAAYEAMTALARRAAEGGSWHVQVSLGQTCMWYQRLGDDNDLGAHELAWLPR